MHLIGVQNEIVFLDRCNRNKWVQDAEPYFIELEASVLVAERDVQLSVTKANGVGCRHVPLKSALHRHIV